MKTGDRARRSRWIVAVAVAVAVVAGYEEEELSGMFMVMLQVVLSKIKQLPS